MEIDVDRQKDWETIWLNLSRLGGWINKHLPNGRPIAITAFFDVVALKFNVLSGGDIRSGRTFQTRMKANRPPANEEHDDFLKQSLVEALLKVYKRRKKLNPSAPKSVSAADFKVALQTGDFLGHTLTRISPDWGFKSRRTSEPRKDDQGVENYLVNLYPSISTTQILGADKEVPVDSVFIEVETITPTYRNTPISDVNSWDLVEEDLRHEGERGEREEAVRLVTKQRYEINETVVKLAENGLRKEWKKPWRGFLHSVSPPGVPKTEYDGNPQSSLYFESEGDLEDHLWHYVPAGLELELPSILDWLKRCFELVPRVVVLGRPGSGKTTLLQKMAIDLINGRGERHAIPVFLPLTVVPQSGFRSIVAYLEDQIRSADFEESLRSGRFAFLLDGLDEVDQEESESILVQLKHLAREHPRCPIIVTCRVAFYASQLNGFHEVEISDLTIDQIRGYAEDFFRDKPALAEEFLAELKDSVSARDLARTPLLLGYLCLAYEDNRALSPTETGIVSDAFEAVWSRQRSQFESLAQYVEQLPRQKELVKRLLEDVAKHMQVDVRSNFIRTTQLAAYVEDWLYQRLPARGAQMPIDAMSLIKEIDINTGLLSERARGHYTFSHSAIRELLTARHLAVRLRHGETDIGEVVDQILSGRRFTELFLMFAEIHSAPSACLVELAQRLPLFSSDFREYMLDQIRVLVGEELFDSIDVPLGMVAFVLATCSLHVRGGPVLRSAQRSLEKAKMEPGLFSRYAEYSMSPSTELLSETVRLSRRLLIGLRASTDVDVLAEPLAKFLAYDWKNLPCLPSDQYVLHDSHMEAEEVFKILELMFLTAERLGVSFGATRFADLLMEGEINIVLSHARN